MQDDYRFDTKQNFAGNTENLLTNLEFDLTYANGRYDEQTIKTAWNILEPEQLNLLNQTINQALVNNEQLEQNVKWNSNGTLTSNLASESVDFNLSDDFYCDLVAGLIL